MKPSTVLTALAVTVMLVGGCADDGDPDEGTDTGIANPAAVYCEEQGGTVSGDEPMCTLPDGTVVDAWDLYREETGESAP